MIKKFLATFAVVLAAIMLLCSCSGYNVEPIPGEDYSQEDVVSNGSLAVKQGNYLYFINGVSDYTTANKFGSVVKGAVMRYELDSSGAVTGDPVTIIPKKAFCSYVGGGIYVYGEWIYYATPTEATSASGAVQTDYIEFMRTRTNGTGTEVIKRIKGNNTQFAFYPTALVYFADSTLTSITYESRKETVICDKVSSLYIPKTTYQYGSAATAADNLIYYTVAKSEDDTSGRVYNTLYAAAADGSLTKQVMSWDTYQTESGFDYSKCYTVTIIGYGEGKLYYTKSYSENSATKTAGTFAYDFLDWLKADAAFETSRETKISTVGYAEIVGNGTNSYIADDSSKLWEINTVAATRTEVMTGTATLIKAGDGYVYYYDSTYKLLRYKLDGTEVVEQLVRNTPNTSLCYPTLIAGHAYYFNSSDYNYCYAVKVGEREGKLIGKVSEADASAKASAASASATATA